MSKDYEENYAIPDIYADGIADVELLGPNIRIILFTWAAGQKIVVAKIVQPICSIKDRLLVDMIAAKQKRPTLEDVLQLH